MFTNGLIILAYLGATAHHLQVSALALKLDLAESNG